MHASSARAAAAYRQTHVESSSPLELVALLYDGALRFTAATRDAIARHDLPARRDALSRAIAIVSELQTTLNPAEGGEIAASLDALYTYVLGRLVDVNVKRDDSALDEVDGLLRPLRDAWRELAAGSGVPAK